MTRGFDYLKAKLCEWSDDQRDWFEERAAILEYDAGHDRAEAERIAFVMACRRFRGPHKRKEDAA